MFAISFGMLRKQWFERYRLLVLLSASYPGIPAELHQQHVIGIALTNLAYSMGPAPEMTNREVVIHFLSGVVVIFLVRDLESFTSTVRPIVSEIVGSRSPSLVFTEKRHHITQPVGP